MAQPFATLKTIQLGKLNCTPPESWLQQLQADTGGQLLHIMH
jgi:hypothetical protein